MRAAIGCRNSSRPAGRSRVDDIQIGRSACGHRSACIRNRGRTSQYARRCAGRLRGTVGRIGLTSLTRGMDDRERARRHGRAPDCRARRPRCRASSTAHARGAAPPASCPSRCGTRPTTIARCRSAEGQTISQPYMVAVMTEALAPEPHRSRARDRHRLWLPDRHPGAARGDGRSRSSATPRSRRPRAGRSRPSAATNVGSSVGDGTEGLPGRRAVRSDPRDRRRARGSRALQAQLADGGRLVIPVGPPGFQHLTIVDRRGASASTAAKRDACVFVPLIGRTGGRTKH